MLRVAGGPLHAARHRPGAAWTPRSGGGPAAPPGDRRRLRQLGHPRGRGHDGHPRDEEQSEHRDRHQSAVDAVSRLTDRHARPAALGAAGRDRERAAGRREVGGVVGGGGEVEVGGEVGGRGSGGREGK